MKKVLLSLLIIFSISLTTTAQMFELYHEGDLVEMGGEMTVVGDPSDAEIVAEISIKNISSAQVSVKVRKMEVELVAGSQNYFCWGACFANFIFLSPINVDIAPGETSNEFSGHVMPAGNVGVTKMCYSFFDVNTPNDSTYFYVNYEAGAATTGMFELYHDGELLEMGSEITVEGYPTANELESHMTIKNISDVEATVKCRKIDIDLLEGTSTYFCWAACFADFIYLSPLNVVIPAGESTEEFSGHYKPDGVTGVSTMCYSFFDIDNPNDSTYFYVKYDATLVGLDDLNKNEVFVSNPYPNPATSQVSFDYNLPLGTSSALVSVHNLLGAKVKELELNGVNGKTTVNVNDLNDGFYFYSVSIDNRIVETKRLVISR